MFPNAVMMQTETWNHILRAMIAVRDAMGGGRASPDISHLRGMATEWRADPAMAGSALGTANGQGCRFWAFCSHPGPKAD